MLLPSFIVNDRGDLQQMFAAFARHYESPMLYEVSWMFIASLCGFGIFSLLLLFLVVSCGWPARRKNHWTCYLQVAALAEMATLAFLGYRYLSEFYWPDAANLFFYNDFSCRLMSYFYSWIRIVDNWVVVALTIDSYMAMFTTLRLFGGEIGDRRIGWLIISIIGISAALLLIPDVVLVHLFDSRSPNTAARTLLRTDTAHLSATFPISESCWSGVASYEIGYRQLGIGLIVGFIIPFFCVATMNATIVKFSKRKVYRGSAQSRHGRQFLGVTFTHMFGQLPMACFCIYALIVRYMQPSQSNSAAYQAISFLVYELIPIICYSLKFYLCIFGSREFRKCCCCSNRAPETGLSGRKPGDDGIRRLGGLLSTGPHHQALLEEPDIGPDAVRDVSIRKYQYSERRM